MANLFIYHPKPFQSLTVHGRETSPNFSLKPVSELNTDSELKAWSLTRRINIQFWCEGNEQKVEIRIEF